MKQVLLALVLIAVPVAAFSGYEVYARSTASAETGLGDLTKFETIIGDVQALWSRGDMADARARITDYESAWDSAETAIRPLNQIEWGNVDDASDAALKAIRKTIPSADDVSSALASLMAVLKDPAQPAG